MIALAYGCQPTRSPHATLPSWWLPCSQPRPPCPVTAGALAAKPAESTQIHPPQPGAHHCRLSEGSGWSTPLTSSACGQPWGGWGTCLLLLMSLLESPPLTKISPEGLHVALRGHREACDAHACLVSWLLWRPQSRSSGLRNTATQRGERLRDQRPQEEQLLGCNSVLICRILSLRATGKTKQDSP